MTPISSPTADLIRHHFAGGVYAKETRLPAGQVFVQHKHAFEHLSILARGHVKVTTDGRERVYVAPAVITIPAGVHHAVHALQDSLWFCIHATDCTDPDRVDEALIAPEGS